MRATSSRWIAGVLGGLLALAGCGETTTVGGPGGGDGDGDGNGDGDGDGDGDGGGTDMGETISESTTLSGDIHLAGNTTIAPDVDVVIEAGSSVSAAAGAKLIVQGTLLIDGTADATVSMMPDDVAAPWGGVVAESGGSVTMRYVTGTAVQTLLACKSGAVTCELDRLDLTDVGAVIQAASTATLKASRVQGMSNGAINVSAGGTLTVSDSDFSESSHDLVTASGGNLIVEYTNIGGTIDTYEHCNLHVGYADSLTITRSNIVTGAYGIMIGDVADASITYNNWEGNDEDVSPVGEPTNADFTHNWWGGHDPPTLGGNYDFTSEESVRVEDAGPRI